MAESQTLHQTNYTHGNFNFGSTKVHEKYNNDGKPSLDFSKYARPELVEAISRVVNIFEDAVSRMVLPPLLLVGITTLLSYTISSTWYTYAFLVWLHFIVLYYNLNIRLAGSWGNRECHHWCIVSD